MNTSSFLYLVFSSKNGVTHTEKVSFLAMNLFITLESSHRRPKPAIQVTIVETNKMIYDRWSEL